MSSRSQQIFGKWAPIYRNLGLEPRPIKPGDKASVKGWSKPDSDLGKRTLSSWDKKYSNFGIGLRMGTPLPDGGFLGVVDIDRDDYVRLATTLLNDPPSGRLGAKGRAFFVRLLGNLKNAELNVRGESDTKGWHVGDFLFTRKLCVIPPSIHPDTNEAYKWIGTPLHELDFSLLPKIGE